jgi:hypothetical protein
MVSGLDLRSNLCFVEFGSTLDKFFFAVAELGKHGNHLDRMSYGHSSVLPPKTDRPSHNRSYFRCSGCGGAIGFALGRAIEIVRFRVESVCKCLLSTAIMG